MKYQICEGADYELVSAAAKKRIAEIQQADMDFSKMKPETEIQELIEMGLSPAEALRELRAQREEERRNARLMNQTGQFQKRNTQSNFRIGISVLRFLKMLFK